MSSNAFAQARLDAFSPSRIQTRLEITACTTTAEPPRQRQNGDHTQHCLLRYGSLLGNCPAMRRTYYAIDRVAPTSATVLLSGESGTGKELAAQTIHHHSTRREAPFIALNCGAIPPNLIESELFGHEKGAFTGASSFRRGVFERASGGTLFLDEITEMPMELQVRLLRVLETGLVQRVGAEKDFSVDVRVIAATNRQPRQALTEGKIREDLLFRLSVFPIQLPPLRDREEDVSLLGEYFLDEFNREAGTAKHFGAGMDEYLQRHRWPGNVRQLRNLVQRAHIMADDVVEPDLLPAPDTQPPEQEDGAGGQLRFNVGVSLAETERKLIYATLDHFDGDKRRTARTLGVSLKTLYNRLNSYKATGQA